MEQTEAPRTPDDAVRAIQAGGDPEEHFATLYLHYYRPVYWFFRHQRFSAEESDDLTQDTMVRVFKGVGEFRFEASVDSWVFLIARRVWINAERDRRTLKRRGREVPIDESCGESDEVAVRPVAVLAASAPDPLAATLEREREEVVEEAVAGLAPGMRALVELRLGQELRYGEIAQVLQISTETVKSQLHWARERLRPRLARYFGRADFDEDEEP